MTTRERTTSWKVLRTGMTAMTDDDWADDVSDALPTTGLGKAPFIRGQNLGKNTAVEFVAFPYVAATGLLVDATASTFSVDVTFIHTPSKGRATNSLASALLGRTATEARVATRYTTLAGCLFNVHYRFECDGGDTFALRFHTLSGAPAGADRYEVWYREVVE